jgi:retron-type reverse transcriptase
MEPINKELLSAVLDRIAHHSITGSGRRFPCGVDGVTIDFFLKNRENQLKEIERLINSPGGSRYNFGPLLRIEKPKENGGVRVIYIPRIRDQVVLRLLHEDLIKSYNNEGIKLKTRSPLTVVKEFREALQLYPDPIVVRTDIEKFYDSTPRQYVVDKAIQNLKNPISVELLSKWSKNIIARPLFVAGKLSDYQVEGLPQGLSISASLSEILGNEIDNRLADRFIFFRYVDDIAIVCPDRKSAEAALRSSAIMLKELGLSLSESKTRITALNEGVTWLGLKHYRETIEVAGNRVHRWIRKFAGLRREAAKRIRAGESSTIVLNDYRRGIDLELSGSTGSKVSWFALVSDTTQWKEVDSSLHNMIRSLYRLANKPTPNDLPSVYRAICIRKRNNFYTNL